MATLPVKRTTAADVENALKPDLGTIAGIAIQPVTKPDRTLNIMIYAESGTGKTVFCGSVVDVAAMSPALLIDVEGGAMSLEDFYPDIDVVRVSSFKQLQKLYDELLSGKTKYKTVIVDSLTEVQKFSMEEIMAKAKREDSDVDEDVPRIRDWGSNINQMRRFVRAMRDLPMNVLFTALENTDKDDSTGKRLTKPSFSGKLQEEIPGFMDFVLYMYIKEMPGGAAQRLLLTKKTPKNLAKDRSNRLPTVIEDPTMDKVWGYMTGTLTAPEPAAAKSK